MFRWHSTPHSLLPRHQNVCRAYLEVLHTHVTDRAILHYLLTRMQERLVHVMHILWHMRCQRGIVVRCVGVLMSWHVTIRSEWEGIECICKVRRYQKIAGQGRISEVRVLYDRVIDVAKKHTDNIFSKQNIISEIQNENKFKRCRNIHFNSKLKSCTSSRKVFCLMHCILYNECINV